MALRLRRCPFKQDFAVHGVVLGIEVYIRWERRQAAVAEQDRRNRTVLLGLGITIGLGILTALAVTG